MMLKDISKNFSFDGKLWGTINESTTAKQFYKHFVQMFMARLYETEEFFCEDCGVSVSPYGFPVVVILDSPVRLRVTMTLSCECTIEDELGVEARGGDEIPW